MMNSKGSTNQSRVTFLQNMFRFIFARFVKKVQSVYDEHALGHI
jgi:hypothetical protein